jgi:DNA-binding transcriptional ArsR family regulator
MRAGQVELIDPVAMRALAHPLRLTLLRLLTRDGPATATQLAAKAGVSVPSAGYHLTQLAKYGFIEDAEPGGPGRQRPWRARARGIRWRGTAGDLAHDEPSRLLRDHLVTDTLAALAEFHHAEDRYPSEWQDAAFVLADSVHLTPAELTRLNDELRALYARYGDRSAQSRPPDARPVRLFSFGVPDNPAAPSDPMKPT